MFVADDSGRGPGKTGTCPNYHFLSLFITFLSENYETIIVQFWDKFVKNRKIVRHVWKFWDNFP